MSSKINPEHVYAIYTRIGKTEYYVGVSKNPKRALAAHKTKLECGKHPNPTLQELYKTKPMAFGSNFTWDISAFPLINAIENAPFHLLTANHITRFNDYIVKPNRYCNSDCWLWSGERSNKSPNFRWTVNKKLYHSSPSRIALYLFEKKTTQFKIFHSCNNKSCVNPAHFEIL